MAESNGNNQANVSSAKGVKGGYIFSAPEGTALPTDIKTPLDPAFKCLGFISEDGYVETVDEDSDDIPDMNGDIMDSTNSNRVESAQFTLAEIKAETLKRQYGEKNVTDANGVITVKHNSNSHDIFSYVLELVLKNNRRWRKVIPADDEVPDRRGRQHLLRLLRVDRDHGDRIAAEGQQLLAGPSAPPFFAWRKEWKRRNTKSRRSSSAARNSTSTRPPSPR